MARKLQLRLEYQDLARQRRDNLGLNQIFGMEAEIQSEETLCNFLRGVPIDRGNFNKLCEFLSLDPQEVGQKPPRSFQLLSTYRDEAIARQKSLGLTQLELGIKAEIQSPSTVNNFFGGKPVYLDNFIALCDLLSFNHQEVGQQPTAPVIEPQPAPVPHRNFDLCRIGEEGWYAMMFEQYSLIRLQAPSQFGKTRLMSRMLHRAEQEGHLTVSVTLNAIDSVKFKDAQTFFRHFIYEIESEILEIDESYIDLLMPRDEYDIEVAKPGNYINASVKYLERLQRNISQPLTLGINKLDRLLNEPDGLSNDPDRVQTAVEFLSLLRFMHELSKSKKVWHNFRLILAYSALRFEDSIPIVLTQSPFNVAGDPIELPEFSPSEVAEHAERKGLTLNGEQIEALMHPIGGIPSLIQLTLNRIRERGQHLLTELLAESASIPQIYQDHLQVLEEYLHHPKVDLYQIMSQIATTTLETTQLDNRAKIFSIVMA